MSDDKNPPSDAWDALHAALDEFLNAIVTAWHDAAHDWRWWAMYGVVLASAIIYEVWT